MWRWKFSREGMSTFGSADIPCSSIFRLLQPVAGTDRVTATVREDIQHLVVEAAVRAQRFVRDVERLEVHVELLGDVVARGYVDLQARVHEGRLGTELGIVLVLAELQQVLVAPIARDTRLEAM